MTILLIRNWLILRAVELSIVLVIGPLVVAGSAICFAWRKLRRTP